MNTLLEVFFLTKRRDVKTESKLTYLLTKK